MVWKHHAVSVQISSCDQMLSNSKLVSQNSDISLIKVNIMFSLCLIKHHGMWEWRISPTHSSPWY